MQPQSRGATEKIILLCASVPLCLCGHLVSVSKRCHEGVRRAYCWIAKGGNRMNVREATEFNRLTWPEVNDAIELQKAVILTTGRTEQHGPHLPLHTDLFLAQSACPE